MHNKTILIAGACGSIGSVLSEYWDKQNHQLLLLDSDPLALQSLDKRLTGDHTLIPFDLWTSGYGLYEKLAHEISKDYKELDALVIVSGICGNLQPLQHLPPETWLKMLQVNLTAPFWLLQTLQPLLQGKKALFTTHPNLRQTQEYYWHGFGIAQSALNTMLYELQGESQTLNIDIQKIAVPWLENTFSRNIFPAGEAHWQKVEDVIDLYEKALFGE